MRSRAIRPAEPCWCVVRDRFSSGQKGGVLFCSTHAGLPSRKMPGRMNLFPMRYAMWEARCGIRHRSAWANAQCAKVVLPNYLLFGHTVIEVDSHAMPTSQALLYKRWKPRNAAVDNAPAPISRVYRLR